MHVPTPEELRARRVLLKMRQAELARQAGISQSMVARIEAGSVDPRVSTLAKIVAVLNRAGRQRMTADRVMQTPVISIPPESAVTEAASLMNRYDISQLPVIRDGVPIGCVSESAVMNAIREQHLHPRRECTVREIMEPGFPTVPPYTEIETVLRLLQSSHAVLIFDSGQVMGVITKHDLISLFMEH
jgi:predicted transcriptional regulator